MINSMIHSSLSRKANKSLPPISPSYIEKTLQMVDAGCFRQNKLLIDGGYGDYCMRLFRRKDKNHYSSNVTSVFTSSFTNSLLPNDQKQLAQEIVSIVNKPVENQRQSPVLDEQKSKTERRFVKGSLLGTVEQGDHLFYNYLPEYQKKKWFQVKDRSLSMTKHAQDKPKQHKKKSYSFMRRPNKNRHIFAYMSDPKYVKTIK